MLKTNKLSGDPGRIRTGDLLPLKQFLKEYIERHRRISFRDYMALCLYHPEHGYYIGKRERTGREGDYFTSADLSPLFARLMSRQVVEMWRRLGQPSPFSLVEMGAGRGLFALDFLHWVRETAPEFGRVLRYILIESSRQRTESAMIRLRSAALAAKVVVRDNLQALEPVTGCFFSNELVDAFPVSVVARDGGRLKEVYVCWKDGAFREEFGPLSSTQVAQYVARYAPELEEGCRMEVNLAALDWLRALAGKLERGFVLAIDYGNLAPQLYRVPLPRGTLLAFRGHRAGENVYDAPGFQDLTAHVNFSALIDAGAAEGLHLTGFTTQEKFLMALGESDRFEQIIGSGGTEAAKLKARLQLKRLLNPEDMGEVFKVLIQHRGIEEPKLTGLRYALQVKGAQKDRGRKGPSGSRHRR